MYLPVAPFEDRQQGCRNSSERQQWHSTAAQEQHCGTQPFPAIPPNAAPGPSATSSPSPVSLPLRHTLPAPLQLADSCNWSGLSRFWPKLFIRLPKKMAKMGIAAPAAPTKQQLVVWCPRATILGVRRL